jgi:uncharacterized protein YegL
VKKAAPKKLRVEVAVIIDKSGSMEGKESDVIGGFNKFLADQQAQPGEARMSVVLFDTQVSRVHSSVPIRDVPLLDGKTYAPDGMTALLDAVGGTIRKIEDEIAKRPGNKQPDKIISVIMTDGEENSSREYKQPQIKKMIEERQASGRWEFIFMGANVDAFAEAESLGVARTNASNFAASGDGAAMAFCASSVRVSNLRKGLSAEDLGQFDAGAPTKKKKKRC